MPEKNGGPAIAQGGMQRERDRGSDVEFGVLATASPATTPARGIRFLWFPAISGSAVSIAGANRHDVEAQDSATKAGHTGWSPAAAPPGAIPSFVGSAASLNPVETTITWAATATGVQR